MKRIIQMYVCLMTTALLHATSGEQEQLMQLETRVQTIINIIDKRNKSVHDTWWIDTNNLNLGSDLTCKIRNKGAVLFQDILEGLASANNERYSQSWLLRKRARECCQHILDTIQQTRSALACRVPKESSYSPVLTEKIKALESLKSRVNLVLFMLRDPSPLARTLYHGSWNLPSAELVGAEVPHATRIAWSIVTYNMMPKTIAVRLLLEGMLEQLKLTINRSIRELKKNN